jgi:hypothetical protein
MSSIVICIAFLLIGSCLAEKFTVHKDDRVLSRDYRLVHLLFCENFFVGQVDNIVCKRDGSSDPWDCQAFDSERKEILLEKYTVYDVEPLGKHLISYSWKLDSATKSLIDIFMTMTIFCFLLAFCYWKNILFVM